MKIYQHCHLTDGSLWADAEMRTEDKKKMNLFLILISRTVHRTCIHLFDTGCNENGSMLECHCTPMMGNSSPFHGHCKHSALYLQVFGLKMLVTRSPCCILPSPRWHFKLLTLHEFYHTSSFLRVNWAETLNADFFSSESVTSHIWCIYFFFLCKKQVKTNVLKWNSLHTSSAVTL